jgi:hypothetical protein
VFRIQPAGSWSVARSRKPELSAVYPRPQEHENRALGSDQTHVTELVLTYEQSIVVCVFIIALKFQNEREGPFVHVAMLQVSLDGVRRNLKCLSRESGSVLDSRTVNARRNGPLVSSRIMMLSEQACSLRTFYLFLIASDSILKRRSTLCVYRSRRA